jgi:predicted nucleic acid-binding protein
LILADTSVWVDHLRRGNARLAALLLGESVAIHPFVIGELAIGGLGRRRETLQLLDALPCLAEARHEDALLFVETHRLAATGIGWVDVHLLTAASLGGARVFTLDRRLAAAAVALGLAA